MGGHGGLNILPQKRWNVYNYENREKVRRDEEAAAKEEQLKREQSRKRDTEFRVEQLRQARGLCKTSASTSAPSREESSNQSSASEELRSENDSKHINLFEGIRIFDPVTENKKEDKKEKNKKLRKEAPPPRVVTAEDEKYRLGYGLAGKGVKLPWYMERPASDAAEEKKLGDDEENDFGELDMGKRSSSEGKKRKKSLKDLREERLKRERKEKERERTLLMEKSRRDGGFSLRR